jgi:hypothetical protein
MSSKKAVRKPCSCPICGWEGHVWESVESRPGHSTRKVCPRCASYPRDRLVRLLLVAYARELRAQKLKLVEFGESGRAYHWKKTLFEYWNVDIEDSKSEVIDVFANQMNGATCLHDSHAALISYVLSMIEARGDRVDLLKEFHRLTTCSGRLIVFDDFSFDSDCHVKLSSQLFFHRLRFGRGILAEVKEAGWHPVVVQDYPEIRILSSLELPFLVASKEGNAGVLHEWLSLAGRSA